MVQMSLYLSYNLQYVNMMLGVVQKKNRKKRDRLWLSPVIRRSSAESMTTLNQIQNRIFQRSIEYYRGFQTIFKIVYAWE